LRAGPIDPIRVDDDTALATLCSDKGWGGDGSAASPYTIDGAGWTMSPLGNAPLIYLGNTTAHVIISNWLLQGSSGTTHGIFLYHTSNVDVLDNTVQTSGIGVYIFSSTDCLVENNTIEQNRNCGLYLDSSTGASLRNDSCVSSTSHGIYLKNSANVLIRDCNASGNGASGISVEVSSSAVTCLNNSCWFNMGSGIRVLNSSTATLEFNVISNNTGFGIALAGSPNLLVTNNVVLDSGSYGIAAYHGTSGTAYLNDFEGNKGSKTTFNTDHIQGRLEDQQMSFDNGTFGNRWLDWSSDLNKDGIVEGGNGYDLDGGSRFDRHPLASVVGPPHSLMISPLGLASVQINWLGPNYTVFSPLVGFTLHRSSSLGPGTWDLGPGEASYIDTVISDFEGTYWLTASNTVGTSGPSPTASIALIDLSDPVVNITAPANGAQLNTKNVTISWTANDADSNISLNQVRLDGGQWIGVGTERSLLLTNLNEGDHTVEVQAFDSYNNVGGDTVGFAVDSKAPDLNITSPSNGSSLNTTEVTVIWSAADSGSGLASVELKLDSGAWVNVTSLVQAALGPLGDGNHVVTLMANDTFGNSAVVESSFTVDTVAPTVTIISPPPSTLNTSSVFVNWTGSDANPIVFVVRADLGPWTLIGARSNWTFTGLVDGPHNLYVKAVDAANNSGSDSVLVTIDSTAPSVAVVSPADGSIVADSAVTFVWTASDSGSGIIGFDVWLDGVFLDAFNGSIREHSAGALPDGQHSVEVTATDAAGNVGSSVSDFTVDTTIPVVEFTSPEEGYYANTTYIRVSWTVSGNTEAIDHFNISLDGAPEQDIGTIETWAFGSLAQGKHVANVTAYDLAGYHQTYSLSFFVDSVAPTVSITFPGNGDELGVSNFTATWNTSDETSWAIGYNASLDGVDLGYVGNATSLELSGLQDGGHIFNVSATDMAGNVGRRSVSFTVDVTPPAIEITSPSNGSYLNQAWITIRWNMSDATTSVAAVRLNVDGTGWIGEGRSYEWSQSYAQGNHTVLVRATDRVGNNATVAVSFFVDVVDPIVTIGNLPPYTNTTIVRLQWTGIDSGSGIAGYEVANDSGPWIAVGNATDYTFNLTEGTHSLSVRATDNAGNYDSDSITVTVDLTPPRMLSLVPLEGVSVTTPRVSVSWNAVDDVSGIQMFLVRVDGSSWANVGTTLSYQTSLLGDGPHTVEVRAYDWANNTAGRMANFTIDSVAPFVTFLSPQEGALIDSTSVLVVWNATITGLETLDHFEVSIDGSARTWNGLVNTTYRDNWSEGAHAVAVTVFDKAGNNRTATLHFIVDTLPPLVWFTYPTEGSIVEFLSIYATWEQEDNASGITNVSLQVNGGNWVAHTGPSAQMFTSLMDGNYTFRVRVHDLVGHVAEAMVNFTVDVQRPELAFISPQNDTWLNDAVVRVTWVASDAGTGIGLSEAQVDGGGWSSVGTNRSLTLSGLSEGEHQVTVKVTDFTGKMRQASLYFSVDLSSPTVTLLAPLDGLLSGSSNVTVEWSGGDAVSGVSSYSLLVDGSWTQWSNGPTAELTELRDGIHTVVIRAYDRAGNNASSSSVSFTVDTTPPRLLRYEPSGRDIVTNYSLSLSFSEEMNRSSVVVRVADQPVVLIWSGNNATWAQSGAAYNTTYVVQVFGKELAGNSINGSTGVSWNFTTSNRGTITGKVLDKDGKPVAGATVIIDTGERATSDAEGKFAISVEEGGHNITVSKPGYTSMVDRVTVVAGASTGVSVILPEPPGAVDPNPLLAIIVIALVASVVTLTFALNRKSKPR
jgi:parallel beta-helix repeat protein